LRQTIPLPNLTTFFQSSARESTGHHTPNHKTGGPFPHFSTNPQRSSQQQAIAVYFFLIVFVKALVSVKIAPFPNSHTSAGKSSVRRISTVSPPLARFILGRKTSTVR
jgi:hypothetical protein